jgi:hypothetical protein
MKRILYIGLFSVLFGAAISSCNGKPHSTSTAGSSLSTPDTGGATGGIADTTRHDSSKINHPMKDTSSKK